MLLRFAGCLVLASEVARKTRVLNVVYNASNNELVRTNTLVKNSIVHIDATPFKAWCVPTSYAAACMLMYLMYICIYIHISMCVYVCTFRQVIACVRVCMSMNICMCIYALEDLRTNPPMHACSWGVYLHIRTCACVHLQSYVLLQPVSICPRA